MRQRFYVPQEFALVWGVLVSRYQEYLPEIKMEKGSFIAFPEEAAALLRELAEMASYSTDEDHQVRKAGV